MNTPASWMMIMITHTTTMAITAVDATVKHVVLGVCLAVCTVRSQRSAMCGRLLTKRHVFTVLSGVRKSAEVFLLANRGAAHQFLVTHFIPMCSRSFTVSRCPAAGVSLRH